MTAFDARYDVTLLDDNTVHLFNEGTLDHAHYVLGAHLHVADGVAGTYFAVWAPNAAAVSVVGDFNDWSRKAHPMRLHGGSGIWEIFVAGIGHGDPYKYHVVSRNERYRVDKADPYGYHCEVGPKTASKVWNLDYEWHDGAWMEQRATRRAMDGPMSIYEVHIGSWMRVPDDGDRMLTYREIAPLLADYVTRMGFTHVELMPVMEHPFYASWGYQVTGYFAATSRYGTPQDLMFLIDTLHQHGIGVILDWVPSHFPTDAAGLSYFDGTHLYEHADPRKGHQPDWGSYIFNYGRFEVQNFLRSNALFWLERYHADGLRVDAVASMLHLNFSRKDGEWIPNEHGGHENLEAIDFLRRLNESTYRAHPDTETIAEDSTAWPMVTRPVYIGGLGFGLKWDMGWMHDTLKYFAEDPVYRSYHHQKITFRMMYAFSENYVLPISHDEVVHGKGSLINKMSGDNWTKRANLRALLGYMYGQTGKKFLFMGCEFGQYREWNHDTSIDWHLLQHPAHRGLQQWVADLNVLYRDEPAMHELDNEPAGFEWVDCNDADQSIVSFLRYNRDRSRAMLVVCNFTPVPRPGFRVGVPESQRWDEVLNSDAPTYGGSGWGNLGGVETEGIPLHGRPASLTLVLPPLSVSFFRMVPLPLADVVDETEPTKDGTADLELAALVAATLEEVPDVTEVTLDVAPAVDDVPSPESTDAGAMTASVAATDASISTATATPNTQRAGKAASKEPSTARRVGRSATKGAPTSAKAHGEVPVGLARERAEKSGATPKSRPTTRKSTKKSTKKSTQKSTQRATKRTSNTAIATATKTAAEASPEASPEATAESAANPTGKASITAAGAENAGAPATSNRGAPTVRASAGSEGTESPYAPSPDDPTPGQR